MGIGAGPVGQRGASQNGPDALDRVGVGRVGGQLVGDEPVTGGDVAPYAGREVRVEVVLDQHHVPAELLVGGLQEVAVIGPG